MENPVSMLRGSNKGHREGSHPRESTIARQSVETGASHTPFGQVAAPLKVEDNVFVGIMRLKMRLFFPGAAIQEQLRRCH